MSAHDRGILETERGMVSLEEILVATCECRQSAAERPRLVGSPLLAALRRAGTAHVYVDTADRDELRAVLETPRTGILAEVDGNTVNQPLVRKVLDQYLEDDRLAACASELRRQRPDLIPAALAPLLYTLVLGWIGGEVTARSRPGARGR